MRSAHWLMVSSGIVISGVAAALGGCGQAGDDCELLLCSPKYADAGTGGHDPGDDAGAPIDPDCVAAPNERKGAPLAKCGIFARPDAADAGDGSFDAPFQSLQAAVEEAKSAGKPVYACAKEFAEAVVVPSGVVIYGGLDCDQGWAWVEDARTTIKPLAKNAGADTSEIAMTLSAGAGETMIADVDVIAPDGELPGVSSIAALIEGGTAELVRCTLTAGKGADGGPGPAGHGEDLDGSSGHDGIGICSTAANNPGQLGPIKGCSTGGESLGGNAGDGGLMNGALPEPAGGGTDGAPADPIQSTKGIGGSGEGFMACLKGSDGADGASGEGGFGADGATVGTISSTGFQGIRGDAGKSGLPGQGGGGGGGAKGGHAIVCTGVSSDRVGASGGTGATGSCGGQGGEGGFAGGASIALVSLAAATTLTEVKLFADDGGAGGQGGEGQSGGVPGFGGDGGMGAGNANNACSGGDGGKGGFGGPGGGGLGGPSIGIAYTGVVPKGGDVTVSQVPSKGGPGGPGNALGTGADGLLAALVSFGM